MGVAGPRLADVHESADIDHQAFHCRLMMVSSDRVMESFPQPFSFIDPRMRDGLKEQFEFGVTGEPALCDMTFMYHEVVDDAPGPAIRALDFV